MFHTENSKSLAPAIELSLTSPIFKGLGSDAHRLLEVVTPPAPGEQNARDASLVLQVVTKSVPGSTSPP